MTPASNPSLCSKKSASPSAHSPFSARRFPSVSNRHNRPYEGRSGAQTSRSGASEKVRRAPMTSFSPTSRAASCIRTAPARLLKSVTAIARYPSSAARYASSSGCDAPRRNEKFVFTSSSAYANGEGVTDPIIGGGASRSLGFGYSGKFSYSPRRRQGKDEMRMTNDESNSRSEARMTKRRGLLFRHSCFRALDLIRHSNFVIRVSQRSPRLRGESSLKRPVQKPFSRLRDAEDPEPHSGWIRYIEIVAGLVVPVPPPPGDPLGADDVGGPVDDPFMGKRDRNALRVVRWAHHH